MALLSPFIGFLVLSCINFFWDTETSLYVYLCRPCWLLVYWSLEQEKLFKGWQGNALQFLPLLLIRFLQTPIQVCKSKQVHTRPRKLFTGWQVNAARQVCAVKSSNGTTSGSTTQLPNLLYCCLWVTPRTDRFHLMRNPWPLALTCIAKRDHATALKHHWWFQN